MSHNTSTPHEASRTKQPLFYHQPSQSSSNASNLFANSYRQSSDSYSHDSPSLFQTTTSKAADENNNNFKVMVRIRPPLPRELETGQFTSTVQAAIEQKRISIFEYYNIDAFDSANAAEYLKDPNTHTVHNFTFDAVYDENSSQLEVYETTAQPAVASVLQGYNATILAYGQTGTGKTFTMEGFKFNQQDPMRGITPRSMEEIFKYIENVSNDRTTFMVRVSYLQIYNEVISDLLRPDRTNLHIREDKKKGVFVEGLSEWAVRSPTEIYSLIQKGATSRATAATKMNDMSSRSHAVFIIIVEQMTISEDEATGEETKEIRVGKLNLVDLAGSERVRVTGATGKRLEECKKINQSLSALGNVISALADLRQNKTHIPYRDSKITRLLEDSLGGNCITTMMAMVSPAIEAFGESLSTLKFANRAKKIKNAPIINEDLDQKALLRKYEAEIHKLKSELMDRNKPGTDKKKMSQLEEDKKRAEQDKFAAYQALEVRSREFLQEREEKKRLEEKIGAMYSQMLVGGRKVEDTPQFRTAVEEQYKLIRRQYEERLQDIEKERQLMGEDKVQVDRYKQLLLKQRDIMIALTSRLNERDETIIQLQEELDAYDRIHQETEELLESRDKRVAQLEYFIRQNSLSVPKEQRIETDYNEPILHNISDLKRYKNTSPEVNFDEQRRFEGHGESPSASDASPVLNDLRSFQAADNNDPQLKSMVEAVKRAEKEQMRLRQEVLYKDEKLAYMQQLLESSSSKQEDMKFVQKEIKLNIDGIIESLSSPNEPQKLQFVARDLLSLQKLINSVTLNSQTNIPDDAPPASRGRSEPSDLGRPESVNKTSDDSEAVNSVKDTESEQQRPLIPRQTRSDAHERGFSYSQQQQQFKHSAANSLSLEVQNVDTSYSKDPHSQVLQKMGMKQLSPMSRGSDERRVVDIKMFENKRLTPNALLSKNIGNLASIDHERKPMSVEEMLRVRKDQLSKNK